MNQKIEMFRLDEMKVMAIVSNTSGKVDLYYVSPKGAMWGPSFHTESGFKSEAEMWAYAKEKTTYKEATRHDSEGRAKILEDGIRDVDFILQGLEDHLHGDEGREITKVRAMFVNLLSTDNKVKNECPDTIATSPAYSTNIPELTYTEREYENLEGLINQKSAKTEESQENPYDVCLRKATAFGKGYGNGNYEKEREAHNIYFSGFWEAIEYFKIGEMWEPNNEQKAQGCDTTEDK